MRKINMLSEVPEVSNARSLPEIRSRLRSVNQSVTACSKTVSYQIILYNPEKMKTIACTRE